MTEWAGHVGRSRDRLTIGRRAMIDAFADLTALAHKAGVDPDEVTRLHGLFFDGNVEVKRAFAFVLPVAEGNRSG